MAIEFGKLDELITDELINQCLDKHRIIIYGHAKSGKILIARLLAEKLKRKLIITEQNKLLNKFSATHLEKSKKKYLIKFL